MLRREVLVRAITSLRRRQLSSISEPFRMERHLQPAFRNNPGTKPPNSWPFANDDLARPHSTCEPQELLSGFFLEDTLLFSYFFYLIFIYVEAFSLRRRRISASIALLNCWRASLS